MKRPTSLPRRWILAALALAAPAVSAQDGPILYASQDPRIAEVRQGVAPGSQENQRIERAFVGDWIYRHEIAQATVGFRWTSVRIQAEVTLVMEYSVDDHPNMAWADSVRVKGNFKTFCRFRPDEGSESENIFVTLGIVTWDCNGYTFWGIFWENEINGPAGPDDSDEFPFWEAAHPW